MRVIVDLVRNDDVTRRELLLQGAAGADADDALHPQRLQRINVGAVRDFARRDVMPDPVPRQEGNALPLQRADDDRGTGLSKGRDDVVFLCIAESRHGIQA